MIMATPIEERGYARPDVLVSTDWVEQHLKDPNVRIIESNEDTLLYASGHVPGAVNIPWQSPDFDKQVEKLDKSKTYLVHCYSGSRSAAATKEMTKLNFDHLFDFSGGMRAYQRAKMPVEK